MKKFRNPQLSESLFAGAILLALLLLINPFSILMTSAFTLTLIMILAVAMIAFAIFVWREQPRDEREALYGLKASRLSYFAGAGVLVVAIIVQAFQHKVDDWLAAALGLMVVTKLAVSIWTNKR